MQGDLRNSLALLGVTPLWQVAQWVSRAPPHHTIPAFLSLMGTLIADDQQMPNDNNWSMLTTDGLN